MSKRNELGMAAAKGGLSGLAKVLITLLATAVIGGGGWGLYAATDDEDDDRARTSQTDPSDD